MESAVPGSDDDLEAATLDVVDRLVATFQAGRTALIRTDFTDDHAWDIVVREVTRPRQFDGSPYGPYEPQVAVCDDPFFTGATGESLAELAASHENLRGYVVLADARSMAEAEPDDDITLAYVDLSVEDDDDPELRVIDSHLGRTFRCAVSEFASTEANLAIANMSFGEFADDVGTDGVFRGFE
jgi:hypothetical protein